MTFLYVSNFTEGDDDQIEFEDLTITQDGILVNWTFVARDVGEGENYPRNSFTQKVIENTNCTETLYPNVHECSVTPQPVKVGDFIGIVLPARSRARLLYTQFPPHGWRSNRHESSTKL